MDKKLKKLILDYQASVRTAVEIVQRSGIPLPLTSWDWIETNIPDYGELAGEIGYYKHGCGCKVYLPTGPVDFDFGRMGEIDEFDDWRLVNFASSKLSEYGFETKGEIEKIFEAAVKSGALASSGYGLYYMKGSKRTLAAEIRQDFANDSLPHRDQDELLSLYAHSFLAADLMRGKYEKLSRKLEKNRGLSQKDEVDLRIYFSSWLGYLNATCEGFDRINMRTLLTNNRPNSFLELIPKSDELGRLRNKHKQSLKEFRNEVFHPRGDVKPVLQFAADQGGRLAWAVELHTAIDDLLSMYRILCEVHYLTHDRLGESQIRRQQAKKKISERPPQSK